MLYLLARALGTVYTSAKALAIAAPLIVLVAVGGLLASSRRPLLALAVIFGLAAAGSSFLILRQAPVAPEAHAHELAQVRPLVEGKKLLFLGRDNFILYELRGSKPFTHVRNFYDPYFVEPNFELEQVGSKFDFDSVSAKTLARFPYVLTTRATYASGPPPGYAVRRRRPPTCSGGAPARTRRSAFPARRVPSPAPSATASARRPPRAAGGSRSSTARRSSSRTAPGATSKLESGSEATIEIDLPPGTWNLSLHYDATRPVTPVRPRSRGDASRQPRLPRHSTAVAGGDDRDRGRDDRDHGAWSPTRRSPAGCSAPTRSPTSARWPRPRWARESGRARIAAARRS